MKKTFISLFAMAFMLLFFSCGGDKGQTSTAETERDSIMKENSRLNEFLDLVAMSMDSINGCEKLLFVDKEGHRLSNKEQIRDNIKMFQFTLDEQRKKIAELEEQLGREDDARSRKLRSIISNLQLQIQQKEAMIAQLQEELENKNADIASLRTNVTRLSENVSTLEKTNMEQGENLKMAESEIANMSVAYVKVGTKKQLSAAGLLKGGFLSKKKLNMSAIDNSSFTKVDTRQFKRMEIPGKDATLVTQHPQSSYSLSENGSTCVLEITNPTQFWSTSHYLIIQYK